MKKLSLLLLLILFSALVYFSEGWELPAGSQKISGDSLYTGGILKSELKNITDVADYDISVDFDPVKKEIFVEDEILWRNKTEHPTDQIQFHLYPNGYKSNRTLFTQVYKLPPEGFTYVDIKKFTVNGADKELIYFQPEIQNPYDSTVAKVMLDKPAEPGDSVRIHFSYKMRIPRNIKRLGYATGRNFFFISQWFPKVGVLENSGWVCSQFHGFTNFYSDFGNYKVSIKVPENYKVAATGMQLKEIPEDGKKVFTFGQKGVHDFVWLAADTILRKNEIYKRKDGSEILIQAYIQPERESYTERYFAAVKNALQYFEDHIGIYPYRNISLVDVPRTSGAGGMEYPTVFTVSAELFSPVETHQPESLVTHEFSHQFYYGIIANNEVYDAWLDEGLTTYITTKIMHHGYPAALASFKFAGYIPVFGLDFLSYRDIPIIYTLVDIQMPEGSKNFSRYYQNLTIGAIADTSYLQPSRLAYVVNSYNKPDLVLLTLERYLGYDKMMKILREYYDEFKFRHPKTEDFLNIVRKNADEDMEWFFDEFIRGSKYFDYKISTVTSLGEGYYAVFAERKGDGFFKNDIALITGSDTLYQKWDTPERYKIFYFRTDENVIAAEIDPLRKNMLDINIANNSYTTEPRNWASLSIAMRLFFWFQNALMILGSIG